MEGGKTVALLKIVKAIAQLLLWLAMPKTVKFSLESSQAASNYQSKNTVYAIKRLIGRRFSDDIVQKDIKMVPYKIIAADMAMRGWKLLVKNYLRSKFFPRKFN